MKNASFFSSSLQSKTIALLLMGASYFIPAANVGTMIAGTVASCPAIALAEDVTNVTEGISGDVDARRRSPVLTVEVKKQSEPKRVTLLADAYIPNGEFTKYPIKFEFFVNRKLVLTQIRATEQPGPIGMDVSEEMATPPFDYAVVATVLHPNRQFTTILYGSTTANGDGSVIKLDCTLSVPSATNDTDDYFANEVEPLIQSGSTSYKLGFQANNADSSAKVSVEATIDVKTTAGSEKASASGSVSYAKDTKTTTIALTGEATVSGNVLLDLSAQSEDGNTSLSCQ